METVKGPDSYEERIERMVNQYQLPLLRLCYAYLHDEELAKDAVQETFIKAYHNLARSGRIDVNEVLFRSNMKVYRRQRQSYQWTQRCPLTMICSFPGSSSDHFFP